MVYWRPRYGLCDTTAQGLAVSVEQRTFGDALHVQLFEIRNAAHGIRVKYGESRVGSNRFAPAAGKFEDLTIVIRDLDAALRQRLRR
jgi:hypothetical protein